MDEDVDDDDDDSDDESTWYSKQAVRISVMEGWNGRDEFDIEFEGDGFNVDDWDEVEFKD